VSPPERGGDRGCNKGARSVPLLWPTVAVAFRVGNLISRVWNRSRCVWVNIRLLATEVGSFAQKIVAEFLSCHVRTN
jgi:hypothetical protein